MRIFAMVAQRHVRRRPLRLEPPTDRSLVWQVLRGKSCFEVTLFPGDDHEPHERNGWNERNQQGETVDPERETELKKREGEIDGVPAEAVGPRANDRCGGAVAGMAVPAARIVRTAETKRAMARTVTMAPIGVLTECGTSRAGQRR